MAAAKHDDEDEDADVADDADVDVFLGTWILVYPSDNPSVECGIHQS